MKSPCLPYFIRTFSLQLVIQTAHRTASYSRLDAFWMIGHSLDFRCAMFSANEREKSSSMLRLRNARH